MQREANVYCMKINLESFFHGPTSSHSTPTTIYVAATGNATDEFVYLALPLEPLGTILYLVRSADTNFPQMDVKH